MDEQGAGLYRKVVSHNFGFGFHAVRLGVATIVQTSGIVSPLPLRHDAASPCSAFRLLQHCAGTAGGRRRQGPHSWSCRDSTCGEVLFAIQSWQDAQNDEGVEPGRVGTKDCAEKAQAWTLKHVPAAASYDP